MAFLEAVRADSGLQEKLQHADGPASLLALANEAGFHFTDSELMRCGTWLADSSSPRDAELDGVSGGSRDFRNSAEIA